MGLMMNKLSKLLGKTPVLDTHLSFSGAYKVKSTRLNETKEETLINQNHNGQQIASDDTHLNQFWDWFAGSATIDEKGRPIVFYHGSPYKFDKFKTKHTFFSTSFKFARDYAADKSFEQQLDLAPKVYDCYLRLKNPLNIGSEKSIKAILKSIKGQEIHVYGRSFSERDLEIALEGKTPYNYLENFDEAKVGDYIYPLNKESTTYMVGNSDYVITKKTTSNIYAVRFKDEALFSPQQMFREPPKTFYEMMMVSNNVTSPIPNNTKRYKPTNGVYISVPYDELQGLRIKNFAQNIDVDGLKYGEDGVATVEVPFKIKGSFIMGYTEYSEEQEIALYATVEVRVYTNKENAKLVKAGNTWGTVENMMIGNETFFDFIHNIGFDSIYIMEDGVLNVCVFDNSNIRFAPDFKQVSSEKPITEAKAPKPTLVTQNHLGNPIAKDEESLKRFWKWFGKSATVDQKGRPFVFYHGSAYTFNKFEAHPIIGQFDDDDAVFFSASKKFAEGFGSDRVEYQTALEVGDEDAHEGSLNMPDDEDDYIEEEHLYECYLRVMNPFNPKNKNNVGLFIQWVKQNVPAETLRYYKIDFDMLKSSLSGSYLINYTNDLNSLNIWDIIKISAYADSKPVETVMRNQNPSNQIEGAIWQNSFNTYAQVFYKGKRTALAYSISPVDYKSLQETAKKLSKNGNFEINFKVSPAMVADRVMRSGIKFIDAVSKKVPATFPVEISWGERAKKKELLTVPVNIVVWTITEKSNARSKSYKTIWEEMESLIIAENYSFVGILKELGFDSFYTYEEGYLNLAVFDPKNIKSVDNVGKWGRGKNIYESSNEVLNEMHVGDPGDKNLVYTGDFNTAVDKLIDAYKNGVSDAYAKTDLIFTDAHHLNGTFKTPITLVMGVTDEMSVEEDRKKQEFRKQINSALTREPDKTRQGSGLLHLLDHSHDFDDFFKKLPKDVQEHIGYLGYEDNAISNLRKFLKSLPHFIQNGRQFKHKASHNNKTVLYLNGFVLVLFIEDKPKIGYQRVEYANDFTYVATFYKLEDMTKLNAMRSNLLDYLKDKEAGRILPPKYNRRKIDNHPFTVEKKPTFKNTSHISQNIRSNQERVNKGTLHLNVKKQTEL